MYTKYESVFYYKNPDIQLIINLQRVKDELGALLHVDHCDRCMGLKCKCLDAATVEADTAVKGTVETANGRTAENYKTAETYKTADNYKTAETYKTAEASNKTKDVFAQSTPRKDCTRMKDAKAVGSTWMKDATSVKKDLRSTDWMNFAPKDVKTTNAKWSFKFSPLNIEEDIWRRADRHRRPLEEKYLSSETVEEFFLSLRKRSVKCS